MKINPPRKAERIKPVRRSARNAGWALGCLLGLFALTAQAEVAGTLTHLSGTLVGRQGDGASRVLGVNSTVQQGETLVTQDNTFARVKFIDGGEVVLRPNSQLKLEKVAYRPDRPADDGFVTLLIKGGLRMVTGLIGKRNPNQVRLDTVTATIGIRGTHFGALMCQGDCTDIRSATGGPPPDGLHLDVAEGAIEVRNEVGQQLIAAGQFGYVGGPTARPTIVPPGQGLRVTMPPSISQNNAAGRSVDNAGDATECTVQ